MFGFSFGELLLIMLVGIVILGPKELIELVRSSKKLFIHIQDWYNSYLDYFKTEISSIEEDEDKEIVNYILDLDGKIQRTYDISKIVPDLKQNVDD
jgi:Sec-independent protein translocase protein TatA